MRKKLSTGCLIATALGLTGCKYVGKIPVIGLDKNGKFAQVFVPEAEYSKRVVEVATTVNDSALTALEQQKRKSRWALRSVLIGVSPTMTVGIGPFQIGVSPKTRFLFSNNKDPLIP